MILKNVEIRDFRYAIWNSSLGIPKVSPDRFITSILHATRPTSDPSAPAFIDIAPPTLPGIPIANSRPLNPHSAVFRAR